MTQDWNLASSYIHALTGNAEEVCDFRCIHDTNKGLPAHTFRGSLRQQWHTLIDYNQRGYGIFICINALGDTIKPETGAILCEVSNMKYLRSHVVDLDNPTSSRDGYDRAVATQPQPHLAVQSSPNKFHIYWLVEPFVGNEFYTLTQRKLAQLYDGDRTIIDPTRVLRLPGFYHLKSTPSLVTWWPIYQGPRYTAQQIADSVASVTVLNHIGMRSQLGDVEMQAPSLDWLKFALNLLDPNELDRAEWLSISAAFKQAGWNLADEQTLLGIWQEWCARYTQGKGNAPDENLKLWHSVRDTEVGWTAFERRTSVAAYMMHYGMEKLPPLTIAPTVQSTTAPVATTKVDRHTALQGIELLSSEECKIWFQDCTFVGRLGTIFSPEGRFMNTTQFNGMYGGKHFIITGNGKTCDQPWKAALNSTVWTIPKVDHVRFLPMERPGAIVTDRMGRKGVNTYIPVCYDAKEGDISLWMDHLNRILPNAEDVKIFCNYIAHCVKFPGEKIPWAFLLQSTEGVGKTVFFEVLKHALGEMYVYTPQAGQLVDSGAKFNAWMRNKLMIVVNEIKVDERRELIEILKPMITDKVVEVQAKGADQDMEDNPANWLLFSNYKDAVPINRNGRRYCISYSKLQSAQDMINAGMDDDYFNRLFKWLENGGYQAITHWLLSYPIERGSLPVRAPHTSSYEEAIRISRSPMQVVIEEALVDNLQGFRGGFISSIAVKKRVGAAGIKPPSDHSIRSLLEGMGYIELGRAPQPYMMEDMMTRPILYASEHGLRIEDYARVQGYEAF